MLVELQVKDLGIVADLTVVFRPGLTAITGETGAGKTLVVEALELLAGGRASPSLVRHGAEASRVDARFDDPATGEEVVLSRVVPVDGRSRAYVDGRPATAGELGERGGGLIDLHGQNAHRTLLSPAAQREALDRFAGPAASEALVRYRRARSDRDGIDAELAGLGGDERQRARESDLLRFQLDEIRAAAITDGDEDARLAGEEEILSDAGAVRGALDDAHEAVVGAAVDAVGRAVDALAGRPPLDDLHGRLAGAQGQLSDLARELRLRAEQVIDDPARLDAVRRRRQELRRLMRKYGATPAEVLAFAGEAQAGLDALEGFAARAAELGERRREAEERMTTAASDLSAARRVAAGALAEAATGQLRSLAMGGAHLGVSVQPADPGVDGADDVTFLLAANPGEPARPLARVASGGELARTMLALRVALHRSRAAADSDHRDPAGRRGAVLVFDEVDAGIGGEAGLAVGRALAALAAGQQVLCVTHLAQVAAFADHQVAVAKAVGSGRTVARARTLDAAGRVEELSRMLSGSAARDRSRDHAEELLASAAAVRQRR